MNLLMIFGSLGWIVVLTACGQMLRRLPAGHRAAWIAAVGAVILLGIGSHSGRDHWGIAHICLQPLVLAGLACVAGRWHELSPFLRWLCGIGAAVDLVFGILLHYAVQGFIIERWVMPDRPLEEVARSYNQIAIGNYVIKNAAGWRFVGDAFAETQFIPVAVAGVTSALVLLNIRRQSGRIGQPRTATSP